MATKKAAKEIAYAKGEDRQKALDNTLAHLEKTFGKGAIMRLGDNANMNVEAISTGSLSLDMALGIGGVPRGVSSIFSNINQMDGVAIDSIFDVSVLPDYRSYDYTNCPYCKQGIKVDALVNRNGYSML